MTGRDWPIQIQKADGGYVITLGKGKIQAPIIVTSHTALEEWLREFYGVVA